MQTAALQKKTTTSPDSHTQNGSATLPAVPVYQQNPIQKVELEEEKAMQAKLATQLKADITTAPPPSENSDNNDNGTAQLKELEEMPLQGKFIVQKKELEEELPMQGKFIAQRMELEEEQPVQGKFIIQRKELEEQLPIQPKFKTPSSAPTEPKPFQRFVLPKSNEPEAVQTSIPRFVLPTQPIQKKANNTGLPDNLKSGVENLSGFSMDDVKVHYNSARPAQLQAHAYAQGTDIHIGPGQEKHLPHEAWHVVQQKQGRVQATVQMKGGVGVNDDEGLEGEADAMGAQSLQMIENIGLPNKSYMNNSSVIQAKWIENDGNWKWDTSLDGVEWFHNKEDDLYWFLIKEQSDIKEGNKEKYLELEKKKKIWSEWNKISVAPIIQEVQQNELIDGEKGIKYQQSHQYPYVTSFTLTMAQLNFNLSDVQKTDAFCYHWKVKHDKLRNVTSRDGVNYYIDKYDEVLKALKLMDKEWPLYKKSEVTKTYRGDSIMIGKTYLWFESFLNLTKDKKIEMEELPALPCKSATVMSTSEGMMNYNQNSQVLWVFKLNKEHKGVSEGINKAEKEVTFPFGNQMTIDKMKYLPAGFNSTEEGHNPVNTKPTYILYVQC